MKTMITKNFSTHEFRCRCECGLDDIDLDLVKKLQIIRDLYGRPMSISSGCRCDSHNENVGGEPYSYHLQCKAADIRISKYNRDGRVLVIQKSLELGLSVGINDFFLHLDIRPVSQQRVFLY